VAIAVDDFGTGYSSVSYLKSLPIDKLKIDREFIGDLLHDPDDATIVNMIIAMAQALEIRATAEGVENEAQLRFLEQHGCDEVQGYLLCPPLAAEACLAVLRQSEVTAQ
jgi:EAL domain-containing protein (putative c-di-GMP-specific phosphodiesterase class I)